MKKIIGTKEVRGVEFEMDNLAIMDSKGKEDEEGDFHPTGTTTDIMSTQMRQIVGCRGSQAAA